MYATPYHNGSDRLFSGFGFSMVYLKQAKGGETITKKNRPDNRPGNASIPNINPIACAHHRTISCKVFS